MAKGSKREGGGIGELLAYAGDRKFLTYLGMALSALSQLLSFGPYVCIWPVSYTHLRSTSTSSAPWFCSSWAAR